MNATTLVPAGYAIEEIDLTAVSDELMRKIVELTWAFDREVVPEDPDRPAEAIEQQFRTTSPFYQRRHWGAFSGDRLVGGGFLGRGLSGSNLNHRDVWMHVLAAHRRHGLGRALFTRAVEAIGESDDIVLNAWTSTRVPASGAFAERVGATPGLRMRTSQLDLQTVDRALIREWATLDPQGYRIVWITGRIPDELMENVLDALRAINRMPHEDLQMEDWVFTAELLRDGERQMKARGREHWFILALDEKGASAGFTDVAFDRRSTHVVQQRGTAVVPEHQGKGIGKWMKARMTEKILAEIPGARFIRTDNAGTNAAMLGINIKMGFRPAWENTIWQVPLPAAQKYVRR
jgi:GNAT superfamily N-acetyltransferase